jgi:adenylyltransferase/sulfurtransferase
LDATEKQGFEKEFYSRQTILKELGEKGQQKLAASKVAIVGAGGLGTVSSLYLVLAGVGYIRLIDQDTIEPHNLHRQILYNPDDLHYPKTEVLQKVEKQNPMVTVEAIPENVHAAR